MKFTVPSLPSFSNENCSSDIRRPRIKRGLLMIMFVFKSCKACYLGTALMVSSHKGPCEKPVS